MHKFTLAILLAAALYAQSSGPLTPAQRTQYMRAACKGKVNAKGECTACLGSGEAGITDLADAVPGSFTAPGSQKEVVLFTTSTACEPHANNFGGAVLLRFENGAWRNVHYEPGITGETLRVLHVPSGRDLLVSQGGFVQSGQVDSWISVITVSNGGFKENMLLRVSDPGGTQCDPKDPIVMHQGSIKKVEVVPGGIHAQVQVVTSHQRGDADGACTQIPGSSKTTKLYDLEYVLQGDKVVVAPSSAATAALLKKLVE
ncbi:MAG TPA: hypothetical protein VGL53_00380 [Bryobacteraceae bacterium]|jgi:hypothetical protein